MSSSQFDLMDGRRVKSQPSNGVSSTQGRTLPEPTRRSCKKYSWPSTWWRLQTSRRFKARQEGFERSSANSNAASEYTIPEEDRWDHFWDNCFALGLR